MKSSSLVRRVSVAITLAASVTGCTSVVSEKPIFQASDFDKSDGFLGLYRVPSSTPEYQYLVEREGPAEFKIIGLASDKKKTVQFTYADFGAVPLGGGDYVLQMSCALWQDDNGWAPSPKIMTKGYTNYALVMRDRRADTYWILANFSDIDSGLLARYGVANPPVGKSDKDTSIDVLPASMPRQKAIAFFRDVIVDAMTKAHGSPGIAEHADGGASAIKLDSDEAKAITVSTPQQCRAATQRYLASNKK